MFKNVTPEKAIAFTRYSVALICCWPLPKTATKFQSIRYSILRFITVLNAFLLFLPLLYALYVYHDDVTKFFNAASLTLPVCQAIVLPLLCIFRNDRLQRLIEEMVLYCAQAKPYERGILQKYIDAYSTFYGVSAMWFYTTAVAFVLGALLLPQPFPSLAEYPFPVDCQPVRSIIYMQQAVVGMQCAAVVCIHAFGALLVLFAAARFEILLPELSAVKDNVTVAEIWRKYRSVRSYSQEVVSIFRYMALSTVVLRGITLVICGISWIRQPSFTEKIQLLFLSGTQLLEVFMCVLPVDKLMDVSENVVLQGIYQSVWYERRIELQKSVLFMLTPQKPVTIRINCVIPALSMNYFSSYVANVFSFFTALRVIIGEDN